MEGSSTSLIVLFLAVAAGFVPSSGSTGDLTMGVPFGISHYKTLWPHCARSFWGPIQPSNAWAYQTLHTVAHSKPPSPSMTEFLNKTSPWSFRAFYTFGYEEFGPLILYFPKLYTAALNCFEIHQGVRRGCKSQRLS